MCNPVELVNDPYCILLVQTEILILADCRYWFNIQSEKKNIIGIYYDYMRSAVFYHLTL